MTAANFLLSINSAQRTEEQSPISTMKVERAFKQETRVMKVCLKMLKVMKKMNQKTTQIKIRSSLIFLLDWIRLKILHCDRKWLKLKMLVELDHLK